MLISVSSRLFERFTKDEANGPGHSSPSSGGGVQFLPAPVRQPVELRLSVVLTYAPLRRDPPPVLKTMKCGIERTLLNFERILRDPFDGVRNRVPMCRFN